MPEFLKALAEAGSLFELKGPVAADFKTGIHAVTIEIFGADTKQNRRKIYRQFELPQEKRLKGLLKLSEREVACVPSLVREDIRRRAGVVPEQPAPSAEPAASAQP